MQKAGFLTTRLNYEPLFRKIAICAVDDVSIENLDRTLGLQDLLGKNQKSVKCDSDHIRSNDPKFSDKLIWANSADRV